MITKLHPSPCKTFQVIFDAGHRSRRSTHHPWKRETPELLLEADSQLDEGTSKEATHKFSALTVGAPKKPMHTWIDERPSKPSPRERKSGTSRPAGDLQANHDESAPN